jgi:thiosulfate/3-mercaptopyruvate sulfurtransferase
MHGTLDDIKAFCSPEAILGLAVIGICGGMTGCFSAIDEGDVKSYLPSGDWIISAEQAVQRHGSALFLDARAKRQRVVTGATPVSWQQFSQSQPPNRGRLLEDRQLLQQRLREVGVRAHQEVIVVGEPVGGWGEDGRIVWMLRSLGHPHARLVDGGMAALVAAGAPSTEDVSPTRDGQSSFSIVPVDDLAVDKDELKSRLEDGSVASGTTVVVDTRKPEEYAGATPYGERRGGHVPGAVHLHYSELLNTVGRLRPEAELRALLGERGITGDKEVVAYCTGGVRSGWFVAVLADLGYPRVRNYAGSMWEWSAGDAAEFPLER